MSALPNHHFQVTGLNVSFDSYIKAGWKLVPIPPGTKGPNNQGWNQKDKCIISSAEIPQGFGVGLAHAYSGTCAIDIDVWDIAHAEMLKYGIDLQGLYDAPDAVTVESGNAGHGKLLYRMPFGMPLVSKKLIYTTPEGMKKNYLDLRCATSNGLTQQDVLPPHRHPITQQLYTFGGKGKWENLPQIPDTLLTYWINLLEQDKQRSIKVDGSRVDASWDDVKSALSAISPDCDRDSWVQCMMAVHYAGTQTDQVDAAFSVFDEWSAGSATKYKGQQDIMNSWRGLRPDKGITLGTLFHKASDAGWQRPMPNVADMFAPIEDAASPKSVVGSFHIPRPRVNYDHIPTVLGTRAKEVGLQMGCDPLVAVWAGLGAACAVADARMRLELLPGYEVPPLLWLCTIGDPSDKKTPAARPMQKIIKTIELSDRKPYEARKMIFEAMDVRWAAERKTRMEQYNNIEEMLNKGTTDIDEVDAETFVANKPVPPVPLRLVVNDITSQKLVRMCAERPRGLLCNMDEMKSWVLKVSNPSSGENRSTWTKSYECDSESMDRVGDGKNASESNIVADNFAVAIYGNLQPRVFERYIKELSDDGLIQRFIPAILDPELSDKKGEPVPDMFTTAVQYEAALMAIYNCPMSNFKLSNEALDLYRSFQDWYHVLKADERLMSADHNYMTALGKIEGTCGRLIFIWHLFENPVAAYVTAETAHKAIEFCKSYVVNALRYLFGEIGGSVADSIDIAAAEYIVQNSGLIDTITLRDLKRAMRTKLADMRQQEQDEKVKDAMHELERANWVRMTESNGKTTQWAISPYLAKQYADYRKKIIAAKQRNMDRIRETSGTMAPRRFARGYEED